VAKQSAISTGVIPGVSRSRTLPPVLPPNFLSRKSILANVAIDRAGVTLIAAPAGYGKTSLAAEFVSSLDQKVIWLTIDDNDDEKSFNAHLMQSIRNVFPEFGEWFRDKAELSIIDFLIESLNELGKIDQKIVMVFDNNRFNKIYVDPYASQYLKYVPNNLHTMAIRRDIPSSTYSALKSIPNFFIFEKQDLEFTEEEIAVAASLKGLDPSSIANNEVLRQAFGWPAAVQLILNNLSRGSRLSVNSFASMGSSEQFKFLVEDLISTLNEQDREILEMLSLVDEFSVEIAQLILKDKYSFRKLNDLATEALFLKHTNDSVNNFAFNSVVRAGLAISPTISQEVIKEINSRLSHFFASRGAYLKALDHAKSSEDQASYRNLFRQGMRQLIATGRGKDLLRMAELVGDGSAKGKLKRQTVELIGYTADFQYLNAQSLMDEMQFAARGSEMENFIKKFSSAVSVYIDFATGLTENLDAQVSTVLGASTEELDLAPIDKISILRVAAAKEIIYDNSNNLIEIQKNAVRLSKNASDAMTLYFLNIIDACVLLNKGEYKDSFAIANNVLAQAEREGYVGLFGPIDALYVKARCLLEFSQLEEAINTFEQIRNLATNWQQHIWVYVAESFLARDFALAGNTSPALEIVRNGRERALSLKFKNGLDTYCDLTELFIKYTLKDWDRVGVLLGRLPDFLLVERIRPIYEQAIGRRPQNYDATKLPFETAKDQIYKYLALAEENIEREQIALNFMRNALEVGASVGAKETFLRQDANILNLIIRIAGEKPTVYLEALASLITRRLKDRSEYLGGISSALTKRELEILRHLSTGKPISAIATSLHISQNTMKTHLKNVYRKIGASGREQAVEKARNLYIL
jgi:LuxR family transcriptional regulator, maltose regulon positive regulatory protein